MSDARTQAATFLDLYIAGQVPADSAEDFIGAWHDSGDEEQRPLTEFLGVTDDEYDVWSLNPGILCDIAQARRPGGPPLEQLIVARLGRMRADNDRHGVFILTHWLQRRGIEA